MSISIFAKAIRRARVASNITQAQLAERLGVSRPMVCQLENPGIDVAEGSFMRVAEALEITPLKLLGYAYPDVEGRE